MDQTDENCIYRELIVVFLLAALLSIARPVQAITYGEFGGNSHSRAAFRLLRRYYLFSSNTNPIHDSPLALEKIAWILRINADIDVA